MVKSSIIVPAQSTGSASRKRSMDQDDEHNDSNNTEKATDDNETEAKKPRLEMSTASRRRGQRLFGVLLGTLNKFKDDSEKRSEGEKKRQEIDTKLHEKLANEKKELAEKMQADKERREQELNMLRVRDQRILDEKRDATNVRHKEYTANYLKTTTTPVLLYRPAKLTDDMEKQISQQKEDALEARKAYEERREQRMKEDEAEDKSALEAAEKRHYHQREQRDDDDNERGGNERDNGSIVGSPRLESPAPEDAVADRDE
ncbi:hypothetical protein RO3G_06038 [Lichtheimia corymbifera JMRC:FSU:9682]|uniref:Pinin/SDK/MemA protein domain-containing protein n=1 Tax=Lichtheimia corymbifera JMRC:FSU:9682 TaxID=1263082 RepID=A0A068S3D3_9FUNG|nr:hypothetical protein RO3G_06038 [Lichtheimia corymbifera JMRC:FSU:9682]